MADAWTTLKNNSTLDSGDAWLHLNNQNAGTGTGEIVYRDVGGSGIAGPTKYIDRKLPTIRLKKVYKDDPKIHITMTNIKVL